MNVPGKKFTIFTIAVVLTSYSVSLSADENVDDYSELSLEELMEIEIGTISSASKYKEKVTQAPTSATVITSEQIKLYGYRTLYDILKNVRGFYTTYERNYGYIGVRGIGRPGDYNSRIMMMIDGQRINENIYYGFLPGHSFPLSVENIKRIEIVRGPGSSLYGSNAFLAVVNIMTKDGKDYEGGEISGELASFGTKKTRAVYGEKFSNDLDALFSATYYSSNGDELYYPEFDSPSTNYGKVRNDDERAKKIFVKTNYKNLTFFAAHSKREKGIPTGPWGVEFSDERNRTWDEYNIFAVNLKNKLSEKTKLLTRMKYMEYTYDGDYVYDDGSGGTYLNKDYAKAKTWMGGIELNSEITDNHIITLGFENEYNSEIKQKNWDSAVYLNDVRTKNNWGVYLQDNFKLNEKISMKAGLRHDYYEGTGGITNPRLAFIYNPEKTSAIKLIYGRAYRAPSPYEAYYNDGDATTKANPDLKPEKIQTWELIYEKYFEKNLSFATSLYYNNIENLIDQVTDPSDGLRQYQNIGEAISKGLEVELKKKWQNDIEAKFGYCFAETEDKSSRTTLTNSPKHLINFNMMLPLIKERFFAAVETKYNSKRKTLDDDYTDDSIVTNLIFTYQNKTKDIEAQFGIYNLFDIEYDHPAFTEHQQDTIEQDGRVFSFKITYSF